jgi:hypothetical protein
VPSQQAYSLSTLRLPPAMAIVCLASKLTASRLCRPAYRGQPVPSQQAYSLSTLPPIEASLRLASKLTASRLDARDACACAEWVGGRRGWSGNTGARRGRGRGGGGGGSGPLGRRLSFGAGPGAQLGGGGSGSGAVVVVGLGPITDSSTPPPFHSAHRAGPGRAGPGQVGSGHTGPVRARTCRATSLHPPSCPHLAGERMNV